MIFDVIVDEPTLDVVVAPVTQVDLAVTENIVAAITVAGPPGPPGQGEPVTDLIPKTAQNGSTTVFTLTRTARATGGVQVFRNGLAEIPGVGFTATTTQITFTAAPLITDDIVVRYEI